MRRSTVLGIREAHHRIGFIEQKDASWALFKHTWERHGTVCSIRGREQRVEVDIAGMATTAGKNGIVRPINALATPADNDHGALKLWLQVDERKMVFETSYRFAEP